MIKLVRIATIHTVVFRSSLHSHRASLAWKPQTAHRYDGPHVHARDVCVYQRICMDHAVWYARVERMGKGFTVLTWRCAEAQGDALFLREVIPVEVDWPLTSAPPCSHKRDHGVTLCPASERVHPERNFRPHHRYTRDGNCIIENASISMHPLIS